MPAKPLRAFITLALLTAFAGCDSCAIFRPVDAELTNGSTRDIGDDIGAPDMDVSDHGPSDVGGTDVPDMFVDAAADMPEPRDMASQDIGVDMPIQTAGLPGCALAPLPAPPTITVGNGTPDSCDEAALLSAISGGNVIAFDCGPNAHTITLRQGGIAVTQNLTLIGDGLITIDAAGNSRIFRIDTDASLAEPHLQLFGMELTGGYERITDSADDCGAAVYRYGGSLTVVDSNLHGNFCDFGAAAVPFGGAIAAIRGGSLSIYDSIIASNYTVAGGGIYSSNTEVKVVRSTVRDNTATTRAGGGLALFNSGPYTICGSAIHDNKARWGGGMFVENNTASPQELLISQSSFSRNSATDDGGAGDLEIVRVKIEYSTFESNTAATGGALWLGQDSGYQISNSTFLRNTGTRPGGAIFATNSSGEIQSVTFSSNETSDVGAAIANQLSAGPLTVSNTIFLDNVGTTTCNESFAGSANLQFPAESTACSVGVINADPILSAREDVNGQGVRRPAPTSPAVGAGIDCPLSDQLGALRPTPCTLGALEPKPGS